MQSGQAGVSIEIHRGRRHLVTRGNWAGKPAILKTVLPRAGISQWSCAAAERIRHPGRAPRQPGAKHPATARLRRRRGSAHPRPRRRRSPQPGRAVGAKAAVDRPGSRHGNPADRDRRHPHRHQIIHRDINPTNIVVASDGVHLTLVDFGLATHTTGDLGVSEGARWPAPPCMSHRSRPGAWTVRRSRGPISTRWARRFTRC